MRPLSVDLSPTSSGTKKLPPGAKSKYTSDKSKKRPYEEVASSEVHFPHFTQLKRLGRGSYGTVVECMFRGRLAAAKLVESNIDYVHLQTEAGLLSELKHENIIKLYAVFQGDQSGLLLELMEGGSMNERNRKPHDYTRTSANNLFSVLHQSKHVSYQACHVLGWTLQTASALNYLHGRGYVHRDLKPSNLLLTCDYINLKLCDFGTAADLRTTMTNNRGSAAWMAPEVFRGKSYDQKCDIYSFGVTLWEMTARRIPFDDGDSNAYGILWQASGGRRPEPIVDCPEPITDLMQRCWADDPQERPYIGEVIGIVEVLCEIYPNRFVPLIDKSTGDQAMAVTNTRLSSTYRQTAPPALPPPPHVFNRSPSIPPPVPPPPKFTGHRRGSSHGSAKLLLVPGGQVHLTHNAHSDGEVTGTNNHYIPNTSPGLPNHYYPQQITTPTPNALPPYNPCLVNNNSAPPSIGFLPPPPPAALSTQHPSPSTSSSQSCSTGGTTFRQSSSTSASDDANDGKERRKKSHGIMRLFNGIKKEFTHGH